MMASPLFSEAEKRFIMAEIIKASNMPIPELAKICRSITPDWEQMQIPHGRNIRQCMAAAKLILEIDAIVETPTSLPSSTLLADAQVPTIQAGRALLNAVPESRKRHAPCDDELTKSPAKRQATATSIMAQFHHSQLHNPIYSALPPPTSPGSHAQPRPLAPQPDNTAPLTPTAGAPPLPKIRGRPRRIPRPSGPPVPIAPRLGTPSTPTGIYGSEMMMGAYSPHSTFPATPGQVTHAQRQTEPIHSITSPSPAYVPSAPPSGTTHTSRKRTHPQETATAAIGSQPRILADEDRVSLTATSPMAATFASNRPESTQPVPLAQQLPPLSETRSVAEGHRAQGHEPREAAFTLPPPAGHPTNAQRHIVHLELKPESPDGHGGPSTA